MRKIFIFLSVIFVCVLIFFKIGRPPNPEHGQFQGIVIPHHALANDILSSSFKRLKDSGLNPEIIVVYGTNHYYPISETYTTTDDVKNNYKLDNVLAENSRVEKDHSISTATFYIKNYFPSAKIVPILVSARYQNLENLEKEVMVFTNKFGSKKTLYIASVDFAHEVSLDDGLNNNNESINAIKNFNYQEILSYKDDYMDSPTAILTLLMSMQNLNTPAWETWYSSHGALITGVKDAQGTSYVIGTFSNTN